MKLTFTLLLVVQLSGLAFGQSFEGRIIYRNTYHTKIAKISDRDWNDNMGTMEEYYIKGGNYKTITNGRLFEWQFYNSKDNKIYTKMSNSATVYWNDGAVDEDSVEHVEVNKSDTVILGYKCDEVVLTCVTGIQKFYFNANSKLAIDASLFENHKFGNWYEYLDVANALPLETIIDNGQCTMISVAIEVKTMHIDDKLFVLPNGLNAVKSPY